MTPALRLVGIVKRFGPTVALDGAELTVAPGEVHALLGENGAGKSTLLSILGGLQRPDAGQMELEGRPYVPRSPRDGRDHGIALIHQELSLFPHLTVAENVLVGIEPRRYGLFDGKRARARTRQVLEEFGHPDIDPDARVSSLSIAAQQVVEICRAIALNARVVLMDEPTSSLQRHDVERLFSFIRRLSQAGVAVVYISHFLEEAREVASAWTVLRDGRTVGTGRLADVSNDELIGHMVGRQVDALFPERERTPSEKVCLDVQGLARLPAVRDASFSLRKGEVLGIFGLMGSGRTEMVRALFGLDRATAGRVTVGERETPARGQPSERLASGLGYVSEDRKGEGLALPLSVADNVTLTRLDSCSTRGVLDPARQEEQATEKARELDVRMRSARQPVRTLSGGNQQKVALARLLHQDADVFLLDEPTRGIDVGSKAQIYEAIGRAASRGRSVLMVSSYIPELLGMCDRLAVMSRGRLGPARPVGQWSPESVMEAAIGS